MPKGAKKKVPTRRERGKTKSFKMTVPEKVWERLDAVAAERGISVAALLLGTTMKEIGPG